MNEHYQTDPVPTASAILEGADDKLRNGVNPNPNQRETPPWSWFSENDTFSQWELSADADMARTMRAYAADLLVVRSPGDHARLLVSRDDSGVWDDDPDLLDSFVASTARRWAQDAVGSGYGKQLDVVKWQARGANRRHRDNTLGSCGSVYLGWERQNKLPKTLTRCLETDLNADRRYIGAPNGVIDLDTGTQLRGEDARSKYVTRRVPDEFDLHAHHPDVDRIFAHLNDEERNYLLDAVAYAVRHGPGKRIYLLVGETNSGKSTVLGMIVKSLGSKTTGYGQTINSDALLMSRWNNPNGHQAALFGIHDTLVAIGNELPEGGRLNIELLKQWDGITDMPIRELGVKLSPARPARATLFIALNTTQLHRVNVSDDALRGRLKILPYPPLPGPLDPDFANRLRQDPDARRAFFAMIVRRLEPKPKARGTVFPPPDIPGVAEAMDAQYVDSIGPLGEWLRDHLQRGEISDVLRIPDLLAEIAKTFSRDAQGKIEGKSERGLLNLARSICGLPPAVPIGRDDKGKSIRGYKGFRLVSVKELKHEAAAERNDEADFDGDLCIQCPGKRATNGDPDNPLCDDHEEES